MTPPRYPRNATPAGLNPAHTYAEIAGVFGLSISRVKQIESDAFRKMRMYLAENPELQQELLDELEEVTA